MRVPVHSVLFKRVTEINVRALKGSEKGQYDVRLTKLKEIGGFADNVAQDDPTPLGGWTRNIQLEPFDGVEPVGPTQLRLRYMGAASERKDYNFAGQASDPYPLWKAGRAFNSSADPSDLTEDVLIVVRDVHDRFHARWIRAADRHLLPDGLRADINARPIGVHYVSAQDSTSSALSDDALMVRDALLKHHNVLLYGPPATGKTRIITEVRESFGGPDSLVIDTAEERKPLSEQDATSFHSAWATFHQSYSYEDFLLGLRPSPAEDGGFRLVPVPGVLLELAEWARQPGHSSLLVIDEINRGNVSRIFGEFITLMEPDKRLDDEGNGTPTTVDVRLPYLPDGVEVVVRLPDGSEKEVPSPFTMPRRVYTLATMNSVDKSVAPLDAALRRRFHVIDLSPSTAALAAALGLEGLPEESPKTLASTDDIFRLAVLVMARLNERLTMFLGPEYQFGQWYFRRMIGAASVEAARATLVDLWRTTLFPQLEDYFLGRTDQLLGLLGDPKSGGALVIIEPSGALEELGAVRTVRARPEATDEDILALLRGIADSV